MYKFNREKILPVFFEKRWSARKLARRAGVTCSTAQQALEGKRIHLATVAKIAAALEINALDYFEDNVKDS